MELAGLSSSETANVLRIWSQASKVSNLFKYLTEAKHLPPDSEPARSRGPRCLRCCSNPLIKCSVSRCVGASQALLTELIAIVDRCGSTRAGTANDDGVAVQRSDVSELRAVKHRDADVDTYELRVSPGTLNSMLSSSDVHVH
jgi:hypothetical protein